VQYRICNSHHHDKLEYHKEKKFGNSRIEIRDKEREEKEDNSNN
jgi:hypothetical protein